MYIFFKIRFSLSILIDALQKVPRLKSKKLAKPMKLYMSTHYTNKYKFRMGDKLLIPIGYGGIANHANTPNVEKIIDGDKIYLQALRAIDNNEEIVFIYGEVGQSFFKKC